MKAELKAARAQAYKKAGTAANAAAQQGDKVVTQRDVMLTRLSPVAQKVVGGIQTMRQLADMLQTPGTEGHGQAIGMASGQSKVGSGDGAAPAALSVETIALLLNEENLVKMVSTIFRKQLGILSESFDEDVMIKLLGADEAELAKTLHADMVQFNDGRLDEAGVVNYVRAHAEQNAGLLLGLASAYVQNCITEMADEDGLAAKVAELGDALLAPVMQAMSKVGFIMSALVIPPPEEASDGQKDAKAMDALIGLAKVRITHRTRELDWSTTSIRDCLIA